MSNPFGGGMGMPGFPMPMMIFSDRQDRNNYNNVPDIIVPARVNKAMEFLHHLAGKRRKGAAANDISIEVLEPDTLTPEESTTQDSALQCLAKYFDGKLQPDAWEQMRFDSLKKQAELGLQEGRVIGCPACHPMRPDAKCPLCKGRGKLFVQSAGPDLPPGLFGNGGGEPEEDE